jgi:hypothetical protein
MEQQQEIIWKPTPKQTEALLRTEFEILFGGARGGGKTDAGQAWLLYDINHPRYRALVIRKNSNDLHDWVSRAKIMFRGTGADFIQNSIKFPKGGNIILGHLKDENAYEKYQGHEYPKILIEELEHIPSEQLYLKLISSCRSTADGLIPQVFATANPGGKGHNWIKKRWNLSGIPNKPVITDDETTGRKRVFIPSRVDDNPYLMEKDPTYIKFLDGLPDGLREYWRLGSWDEYEIKGAFYTAMIKQMRAEQRITLTPYDPALLVHTVWDLGVDDAMSIGFFQRTKGVLRMIDYIEDSGQGLPYYIKLLKEKPYIYGKHFAPHDIKQRELSTGKTRQETAKELGIEFINVPKVGFDDGIERTRLLFSRLIIDSKLEEFINAISQYRREWDEILLKYSDKAVHDWTSHGADMLRYTALVEDQMTNEKEGDHFRQEQQILHSLPKRIGEERSDLKIDLGNEDGTETYQEEPLYPGMM